MEDFRVDPKRGVVLGPCTLQCILQLSSSPFRALLVLWHIIYFISLLCFLSVSSPRWEMLSRPGRRQFQLNCMLTIPVIWLFGHGNKPILSHTAPSGVTLLLIHCLLLTMSLSLGGILHTIVSAARCLIFSTLSLPPVPVPMEAPWPPQQWVLSTLAYQVPADKVAIMTKRRLSKNRPVLRLWKPNDKFAFPGQLASYCFLYNELS